ncbi:hypothetical protein EV702DRAFT_1194635 [Suillus placidus]|uniref:Uncharacterized protein n=1 Tax=Suillus placidus TaxID=48579 RepID=A0A9P7D5I6_9AGAM|nr:hypothetical protein EV702DRAFT_1194635 [Suillus placidus]
MPLRPEMLSLYRYITVQPALALHPEDQQALGNDGMSPQTFDGAYNSFASDAPPLNTISVHSRGPRNILLTAESSLNAVSVRSLNRRNMLPTPEPSLTPASNKKPNSHIHQVLVVDVEVTQRVQMNILCCIPSPNAISLHLTLATLRESQSLVKTLLIMPTSPFLPPPSPTVNEVDVVYASMFVMRHLIMIRCALKKERKKEKDERDNDNEGDVELDGVIQGRRGLWRRRSSNDPRISSSDHVATIIAELASAHYRSSIYDPHTWLQDIAGHVQTPYVEDESLLSVVAR